MNARPRHIRRLLAGASLTLLAGCGAPAATTGPLTVSLPVIGCPTSLGAARPAVSLPSSRPVKVPLALAAELSVYADGQGIMELIGPKGWRCAAFYGADGSGGIAVYPRGERYPASWTAGWSLPRTSASAAIVGLETSACSGCTLGQACRLFPGAAQAWRSAFGRACPTARPPAETAVPIGAGIVGFQDPPGVAGAGLPSGGRYAANGVMTYHPSAPDGSWLETCTLPDGDHAECTAVLNAFVSWYGQR